MAEIPDYPQGFPDDLKPTITAMDVEARRAFRQAAEDLRRAPGYDHYDKLKALFKKRAIAMLAVVAQELCIAVKLGRRPAHEAQSDLGELLEDCIWRTNFDAHEFAGKKPSDDKRYRLKQDIETSDDLVEHIRAITEAGRETMAGRSQVARFPGEKSGIWLPAEPANEFVATYKNGKIIGSSKKGSPSATSMAFRPLKSFLPNADDVVTFVKAWRNSPPSFSRAMKDGFIKTAR